MNRSMVSEWKRKCQFVCDNKGPWDEHKLDGGWWLGKALCDLFFVDIVVLRVRNTTKFNNVFMKISKICINITIVPININNVYKN